MNKILALPASALIALALASCGPSGSGGACSQDLDCVHGEVCVEGTCRVGHFQSCRSSLDCPVGNFCPAGQCLPDCTQLGCDQGQVCNGSTHLCDSVVEAPPTDTVSGNGGNNGGGSATAGGNSGGSTGGSSAGSAGAAPCGQAGQVCCSNNACASGLLCNSVEQCVVPLSGNGGSTSGSSSTTSSSSSSSGGWTSGGSTGGASSSSSSSSSSGGSSTGPAQCTPDTWSNYASNFFNTNCAGCHSQFGSYSGVQSDSSRIESKIQSGSMPPYGGLSASDQQRIVAWINCGMPQ